jgi:hypothetical protein
MKLNTNVAIVFVKCIQEHAELTYNKATMYALLKKASYSTSRSSWTMAGDSPAEAITEVDAL